MLVGGPRLLDRCGSLGRFPLGCRQCREPCLSKLLLLQYLIAWLLLMAGRSRGAHSRGLAGWGQWSSWLPP